MKKPGLELRTVLRGGGLSGLFQILGYGVSLAAGVVAARVVGAQTLGVFSVAFSAVYIAGGALVLGADRWILKQVSILSSAGDRAEIIRRMGAALAAVLIPCIGLMCYYMIARPQIGSRFFPELPGVDQALFLLVPALPFICLIPLLSMGLTGLGRPQLQILASPIIDGFCRVFFLLIFIIWLSRLEAISLAAACGFGAAAIFLALCLRRRMASFPRPGPLAKKSGYLAISRDFISFSAFISTSSIFNLVIAQSDILAAGYFLAPDQVGIYRVVKGLGTMAGLAGAMFSGAAAASIARLCAQGDRDQAGAVFAVTSRIMLRLSGLILVVFMGASEILLAVYGPEFTPGANALRVLAVGMFVAAAMGPTENILAVLGKEWIVLANGLIKGLILIPLLWLLVPRLGVMGAALALALMTGIMNILAMLQIRIVFGFTPDARASLGRGLLAAAAGSILALALARLTPIFFQGISALIWTSLLSALAFIVVLKKLEPRRTSLASLRDFVSSLTEHGPVRK